MADPNGTTGGSGPTAIVAIVALVLVGLLVWFFFLSGGAPAEGGGTDIDVNVGDPIEAATE